MGNSLVGLGLGELKKEVLTSKYLGYLGSVIVLYIYPFNIISFFGFCHHPSNINKKK